MTSFGSSQLQCAQQGAANPPKSGIGRHVVEANRSRIGHRSDRENVLAFDRHKDRIAGLLDPGTEIVRGLVAQPPRQDGRVVAVIGFAKLRDRPLQQDTGSGGVFRRRVSYLHAVIFPLSRHPDNRAGSGRMTVGTTRTTLHRHRPACGGNLYSPLYSHHFWSQVRAGSALMKAFPKILSSCCEPNHCEP
jgi:hypothetical protein